MSSLHSLPGFTAGWAAAMFRACWQGSLAFLAAWVLCRFLPRLSPRLQCWIWRLAYLKLFVVLFWSTPVNLPLLPPPAPAEQRTATLNTPESPVFPPIGTAAQITRSAPQPTAGGLQLTILLVLFGLWILGGGVCALQMVTSARYLRQLRRRCRALHDPLLDTDLQALCRQLDIRRIPQVLVSDDTGCPLLAGLLKPAIVLPASLWNDCTATQRRLILAHELAHVKRQDLFWAWLPNLGRCLFFFHPLVWLAEWEWQQSQEMACDELVMQIAESPRSEYGAILVRLAAQRHPARHSGLAALHMAESYSTVRRRLLAMKQVGSISNRRFVAMGSLVAAAGLFGLLPWHLSSHAATGTGNKTTHQPANAKPASPGFAIWLIRKPEVQTELRLDSAQRDAIKRQAEANEIERVPLNKEEGEGAKQPEPIISREEREQIRRVKTEQLMALQKERYAKLEALLHPQQVERLRELALQWRGPTALADPEVATALSLDAKHLDAIKAIKIQHEEAARRIIQTAEHQPSPTEGEPTAKRADIEMATFRQVKEHKIQAEEAMLNVLSDAERARWKAVLGRPFTFRTEQP